jgi:hypothetical protein
LLKKIEEVYQKFPEILEIDFPDDDDDKKKKNPPQKKKKNPPRKMPAPIKTGPPVASSSSKIADEKCDCGEEGCVFTKKEAGKFEQMMKDYRRIIRCDDPSTLSDSDQFMRRTYLQAGQPPWMQNEEWKQIKEKIKKEIPPRRSVEDQFVIGISCLLDSQK